MPLSLATPRPVTTTAYPPAGQPAPCATHAGVQTTLRCSRCERPICPRCLVQTPVGARCRECARLRRLPTYDVSLARYVKSIAAGAGVGITAGAVWSLLPFGGFFALFITAAIGFAVGEAVSAAANRRRSKGLKAIAVAGVVLAVLTAAVFPAAMVLAASPVGLTPDRLVALAGSAAVRVASNPFAWIGIALGGFLAASRIE